MSKCLETGHVWHWAGSGEIPEGTPCECGLMKYRKPDYCQHCGQKLKETK